MLIASRSCCCDCAASRATSTLMIPRCSASQAVLSSAAASTSSFFSSERNRFIAASARLDPVSHRSWAPAYPQGSPGMRIRSSMPGACFERASYSCAFFICFSFVFFYLERKNSWNADLELQFASRFKGRPSRDTLTCDWRASHGSVPRILSNTFSRPGSMN